jgi:hypothetical protein
MTTPSSCHVLAPAPDEDRPRHDVQTARAPTLSTLPDPVYSSPCVILSRNGAKGSKDIGHSTKPFAVCIDRQTQCIGKVSQAVHTSYEILKRLDQQRLVRTDSFKQFENSHFPIFIRSIRTVNVSKRIIWPSVS